MKDKFFYTITPFGCTITDYTGKDEVVKVPEEINGHKVTEIGMYAFSGCATYVKKIIIPEGVDLISHHAFRGCSKLETIVFPESLRRIFNGAFKDCPSLKVINFKGTKEQWKKVSISEDISHIKVTFNTERSMLSAFLNDCKDAEEIRKIK